MLFKANKIQKLLSLALSVLLVSPITILSVKANIYDDTLSSTQKINHKVIMLVGVRPHELAERERGLLNNKKIIETHRTENWKQSIENTGATEILLKQNSGFVGLYNSKGYLIRPVELADGSTPQQQRGQRDYSKVQNLTFHELHDYGYIAGGRVDPYQPKTVVVEPRNNARLSPGWGYNSEFDKPKSKRSVFIDFLDYAPIDTVTPLNYPGHYDQSNLTVAYGLGIVPHIGGLIARLSRAKAEKRDYDYYKRQSVPDYLEKPATYYRYSAGDPNNPVTSDPNILRYQQMPQAFNQQNPNFGQYGTHGFGNMYMAP